MELADGHTDFHVKGKANHFLWMGFLVFQGIISVVKKVGCQ
jgi:hypothetical protein